MEEWVGPRAGLDDMGIWKLLTLPGHEPQPFGRPARNQALYWLRYRSFKQRVLDTEVINLMISFYRGQ
jgi:hypothetical protein